MDLANFYNLTSTEISAALVVFNLGFSFVLQMLIVYVYKKTRHGLSHSQSFIFTLLIVGTLSTAIMMAVQNNVIGAFAIFAAFTLIRFRTILKESSDLAYVFFALVVGISVGMSHYPLALITVIFISSVIFLFYRFGFGKITDSFDYVLILRTSDEFSLDKFRTFLNSYVSQQEVLRARYGIRNDEKSEITISLRLLEGHYFQKIIDHLNVESSVLTFELLTGKSTSEY